MYTLNYNLVWKTVYGDEPRWTTNKIRGIFSSASHCSVDCRLEVFYSLSSFYFSRVFLLFVVSKHSYSIVPLAITPINASMFSFLFFSSFSVYSPLTDYFMIIEHGISTMPRTSVLTNRFKKRFDRNKIEEKLLFLRIK